MCKLLINQFGGTRVPGCHRHVEEEFRLKEDALGIEVGQSVFRYWLSSPPVLVPLLVQARARIAG